MRSGRMDSGVGHFPGASTSSCADWFFLYRCLLLDYAEDTVALRRELVECSEGKIQ